MGQQVHMVALLAVLSAAVAVHAMGSGHPDQAASVAAVLSAMQGPGLGGAYQKMMGHKHTLSQGHLERSLAFMGSNLRLRRLLAQLNSPQRQHFHVGVIGGSISWGHGVQRGSEDWFSLLQRWMESTFTQHNITFKNGCVPATQSSYVSSCLQQFVDADVDLLFVEYVTNDGYHHGSVDNSLVRSFERLLRKLLGFRHSPAVVLMEFLATDVKTSNLPFYATGEDQYGVLAQYYSVPWLSYRDAVWHDYMANTPGFKRYEIFPRNEERHPTPLGHRYLADMAIHLLQQTYLDSLLYPMDLEQLAHEAVLQVPAPMFEGNWESSNLICVVGEQLPHTVVQNTGWQWVNEGTAVKPKWGFVTWQVGATLVLKVDTRKTLGKPDGQQDTATAAAAAAGPAAAPDPAVQAGGSAASASSPAKVGAAAVTEGKQTELAASEASAAAEPLPVRLSMDNDEVIELPPLPDMIVWVGYVKSWRDMGTASFNCIKGCSCQGTSIDALHDLGNTQQHMVKLYATEAAECLIEVKVNPWSRTKDHKFKVTAIMVTHSVEFSGHGDFTDSVLLDNITPKKP